MTSVSIPNRPVFRAQEVCELAEVQPYVLRTWEEIGPTIRPEEPNSNVTRLGYTAGLRVRPA